MWLINSGLIERSQVWLVLDIFTDSDEILLFFFFTRRMSFLKIRGDSLGYIYI